MLKKLISLSLTTAVILGSLGAVGHAQQVPISLKTKESITQTQLESGVPSMIIEGFEAFCSGQAKNPFAIWAEHGVPVLREAMTSSQITGFNQMFEGIAGKCIGYSVISSTHLTERTQIIYVESAHENIALFWQFTLYRSPNGWAISSFDMNTSVSEIIPSSMLIGR
jgi:hypothetical protein